MGKFLSVIYRYRPIRIIGFIGDYRYRPIWKKAYRSYTAFHNIDWEALCLIKSFIWIVANIFPSALVCIIFSRFLSSLQNCSTENHVEDYTFSHSLWLCCLNSILHWSKFLQIQGSQMSNHVHYLHATVQISAIKKENAI